MSLTVCIVVYNEEKNVSVIEQNLKLFFERAPSVCLVLVDNGSTDQTPLFLRKMADQFGAHLLQRIQNHLPQARDQALHFCQTEWISFIDADCWIDERWLDKVMELYSSNSPSVAAYGGPWQVMGPAAPIYQSLFRSFLGHFGHAYLKRESFAKSVDHLPTANIFYHRDRAVQVGGFRSTNWRVGEDLDLSFRLKQAGFKILYVPQMEVFHKLPASLGVWAHKMFLYGTARGELSVRYRNFLSYQYLLPLIFGAFILLNVLFGSAFLIPLLAVYLAVCGIFSLISSTFYLCVRVFVWMVTTHFSYSIGILFGFLKAAFWRGPLAPQLDPLGHKAPATGRP